jgi:hypothetical protein
MDHAFQKLVKRIRRAYGPTSFEYLLVWELHQSGRPHMHLLQHGAFIPYRWLRSTWEELTGSYMVDIRPIRDTAYAIKDIALEMTKSPAHNLGKKHYRTSRSFWPLPEHPIAEEWAKALVWEHHDIPLSLQHQTLEAAGYFIIDLSDSSFLAVPPTASLQDVYSARIVATSNHVNSIPDP